METAAEQHGAWNRGPDTIHVQSTGRGGEVPARASLGRPHIITHRTCELGADEIVIVSGIPTTSPVRTCLDLGRMLTPLQLTSVVREMVYQGILDVDELARALEAHAGEPWTRAVRDAIRLFHAGCAGTRSRSEDELDRLRADAGLPAPIVNVRGATGFPQLECDFVWPDARVVVELDGGHHQLPGAAERDAAQDEMLRAGQWRILRFDHGDVWRRPRTVLRRIASALGR